jgi:ribonuclease P protein component
MWQRLVHSSQFSALLAQPQRWRSAHFAVHHAPRAPEVPVRSKPKPLPGELSTAPAEQAAENVDKSPVTGRWWASVVPKRHARRAVTRNVVDRQVQAALLRAEHRLAPGQWLLRLRAPLSRDRFRSADSAALRAALRDELDHLLARCERPQASRNAC